MPISSFAGGTWVRAWAPRFEEVWVEYHYLRTGRVTRVALTRADAGETLDWARTLASRIAAALATPDDPGAFPPRPSTACGTCPWVNRCPAGQASLEAMDEEAIPDDVEARRLAGLLLAGEARVGRLRERLKAYLQDREPLTLDGLELGFFPTKGRSTRQPSSAQPRTPARTPGPSWPPMGGTSRPSSSGGRAWSTLSLRHGPRRRRGSAIGKRRLQRQRVNRGCPRAQQQLPGRWIQSHRPTDRVRPVRCDRTALRS